MWDLPFKITLSTWKTTAEEEIQSIQCSCIGRNLTRSNFGKMFSVEYWVEYRWLQPPPHTAYVHCSVHGLFVSSISQHDQVNVLAYTVTIPRM